MVIPRRAQTRDLIRSGLRAAGPHETAPRSTDPAGARARASSLGVFRGVLEDEPGVLYLDLLKALSEDRLGDATERHAQLFGMLALQAELYPEELIGDAWQNHLLDRIIRDENAFSVKAQRASPGEIGDSLLAQARQDLATLQELYKLTDQPVAEALLRQNEAAPGVVRWGGFAPLKNGPAAHSEAARLLKLRLANSSDWSALAEGLAEFYFAEGSGIFARYRAFRWSRRIHLAHAGHLEGISRPDPIRLEELIAYDEERALLIENTEQFVDGYPANNVLLYGDRGTGKSSTIKGLLHAYGERGLRLIEVPKQLLADFPYILAELRGRRERFIIFVDDLSFDEHETIYKELKAVLEGSLEARPENVLVYATSNRRHLIVERFSDHDSPSDSEIHQMDTVQEKLSLSDRFGLRLFFLSPDQKRYLEIVRGLAQQRSLEIAPEDLERQALQWATWQNGRSGRTARQFIDHLTGSLARRK